MFGQRNEGKVMENDIEEQMIRLLQVMNERQAKGDPNTDVFPQEVAHEADLDPESSDYQEVLDELRVRGYLKDSNIGGGLRITRGGMARLAEGD